MLYAFTTHTFTNANTVGKTGPTLDAVRNAYSSASWTISYLNMTNNDGIQLWTVPVTGNYKIQAVGAGVPYNSSYTSNGQNLYQKGMDVTINTTLTKDEVIRILVGQMPSSSKTAQMGGAGGTFVIRDTKTPILVAGGGGGSGMNKADAESNATDSNTGQSSAGNQGGGKGGGKGGSDGNGGTIGGNAHAGCGGGLLGNGSNSAFFDFTAYPNNSAGGGTSFTNGGIGGKSNYSEGGFGGGGACSGDAGGGGGGGYSGGGGGSHDGLWSSGGGGGSFSITGNFTSSSANNNGHGSVVITLIK
jgi:hypothetical protein